MIYSVKSSTEIKHAARVISALYLKLQYISYYPENSSSNCPMPLFGVIGPTSKTYAKDRSARSIERDARRIQVHIIVDVLVAISPVAPRGSALLIWSVEIISYNTIQYNTIQYNTIQYNTIQYNTIQYNTIQYTIHIYICVCVCVCVCMYNCILTY